MPTRRTAALILLLASAAILAAAFAFQHLGGLAPCALCIYQRYPYAVVIALTGLALAASGRVPLGPVLVLSGLALLADAAIAGFHVGVEQRWWAGTAECGGTGGADLSLEELKAQVLAAPVVRCDEVPWSLFGISMAGYNLIMALALAVFALAAAARPGRKAT